MNRIINDFGVLALLGTLLVCLFVVLFDIFKKRCYNTVNFDINIMIKKLSCFQGKNFKYLNPHIIFNSGDKTNA